MAAREQIQALLEVLGPSNDEIAAIAQNGDNEWAVAYGDDTIVTLDLVESQAKLVLSIDLGRPRPDARLAIYETLLNYNLLWPATGGIKMGLGGTDGDLVQMFELGTGGLDLEGLRTVLDGFVEKARIWRRVVADGARDGGDAAAVPPRDDLIIRA